MKGDKVMLIEALMKAHNVFARSMTDSGYHIFWDDDRSGKIYKSPTHIGEWPIGKVEIRWEVKANEVQKV